MSTRPRKRKLAGVSPGEVKTTNDFGQAVDAARHQSGNSQVSWTIPPGGDGFTVEAHPGKVIINQTPICADPQNVVLNVDEALRLNVVLLSAIEAATGRGRH